MNVKKKYMEKIPSYSWTNTSTIHVIYGWMMDIWMVAWNVCKFLYILYLHRYHTSVNTLLLFFFLLGFLAAPLLQKYIVFWFIHLFFGYFFLIFLGNSLFLPFFWCWINVTMCKTVCTQFINSFLCSISR